MANYKLMAECLVAWKQDRKIIKAKKKEKETETDLFNQSVQQLNSMFNLKKRVKSK